jgi:hypothetical protein
MSSVRYPTGAHSNSVPDRVARRKQANAIAFAQQEPSPLTVMLVKMRFDFALAKVEAAKGNTSSISE